MVEFYLAFWNIVVDHSVESLDYSYDHKQQVYYVLMAGLFTD